MQQQDPAASERSRPHEIDTQSYRPALTAHLVLAAAITLGAIATGTYLLVSR